MAVVALGAFRAPSSPSPASAASSLSLFLPRISYPASKGTCSPGAWRADSIPLSVCLQQCHGSGMLGKAFHCQAPLQPQQPLNLCCSLCSLSPQMRGEIPGGFQLRFLPQGGSSMPSCRGGTRGSDGCECGQSAASQRSDAAPVPGTS